MTSDKSTASRHWADIGEMTAVFGIRLLYFFYRLGGRFLFWISLWPVVVAYWALLPQARGASRDYLMRAWKAGILKKKPTQLTVLRHIFQFADTILDKLLAVAGHLKKEDLRVSGREELLTDNRGAVIVTGHMGCLELCQALTADPSRLHVLTHTRHARQFNRILAHINPNFAVNHIEVTSLSPAEAIRLSDTVAHGGFLVIAGDRVPIASESVTFAEFLGQKAPFPTGPALIAMLLQCPLWSMICTRNHDDDAAGKKARYQVTFAKLWEPVPVARNQRKQFFETATRRYAEELERHLRHSPFDWFNFFRFWDQRPVAEEGKSEV